MAGKFTILVIRTGLSIMKFSSQVWTSPSILLQQENFVVISHGKIWLTSLKLRLESFNRSLSCFEFVHKPSFLRVDLYLFRLLLQREYVEYQSLSMSLTSLWAWPIKLPISLRLRCTLLLNKLLVSLR